jgi:acetolactate synthase regulatory subunit
MENTENKPNNDSNSENSKDTGCCSIFSTTNEDGKKRPSALLWAILVVILIGIVGMVTSNKESQNQLIKNTNEQAFQSQREADVLQTQIALRNKAKDTKNVSKAGGKDTSEEKIKVMQAMHNKQLEQAQKAFDDLKAAYANKLAEVVKTMQAEQEAKELDVPNPELNFKLRGVSNIRVQFNKVKDISSIEIVQPENCKSYGDKKKKNWDCYPKKEKAYDNKYYKKGWGDCKPSPTDKCGKSKCYPMPQAQKEYKKYKQWDCKPMNKPTQNCGS